MAGVDFNQSDLDYLASRSGPSTSGVASSSSSGTDRKAKDIERGSASSSEHADPYSLRDGYKTPEDLGSLKHSKKSSAPSTSSTSARMMCAPSPSGSTSARSQLH
uniref:Uncharacterized protein n=1 Tax=Ganoderma boninense TaxID=34458 RepID=A0A5K1K2G1_9APHY|nr:Uncharacterized protein [Ganoderma boninense]